MLCQFNLFVLAELTFKVPLELVKKGKAAAQASVGFQWKLRKES
jgi:hypothetical protein